MEKANTKVALEKNEIARREITGVKADTITATNAGDGLVSSKTQVIFLASNSILFSAKKNKWS